MDVELQSVMNSHDDSNLVLKSSLLDSVLGLDHAGLDDIRSATLDYRVHTHTVALGHELTREQMVLRL